MSSKCGCTPICHYFKDPFKGVISRLEEKDIKYFPASDMDLRGDINRLEYVVSYLDFTFSRNDFFNLPGNRTPLYRHRYVLKGHVFASKIDGNISNSIVKYYSTPFGHTKCFTQAWRTTGGIFGLNFCKLTCVCFAFGYF